MLSCYWWSFRRIWKESEKYKDRLIVGVDVNQALAFEASRGKFLTSVEKKIAQSVYDVILGFGFENKEEKAKLQKLDTNKDKTTKKTHSLVGGRTQMDESDYLLLH
ncbi:hypothetical protein [Mycoplasmopsis cynos]|uniref:hypothetical protein n=1 Tax=Mycoplasmopsis cynos TaxID=171284 RepID=UPI00220F7A0E|nr:hypothetical protein [Mycoplasmopsis cynos]UWV83250.1 hypothetical protein NW067_03400 [Mycoplasmopsis cynos]